MNELALFAGAGGGILGGNLLGWRTICAVEWEPYAASVLAARQNDGILPAFPIWDDVRTFDGHPWRGRVDVVSGGFPCQDISAAGKGAGLDGERSGLWSEMARIIREVQPRYAFVENSPMLTSRGLGRVLGDLAEMGFDAEWGVVSAADTGAPHLRERIWIVAHADMPERREIGGACNGLAQPQDSILSIRQESSGGFGASRQEMVHTSGGRYGLQGREVRSGRHGIEHSDWWRVEPDVGRMAHGVAARVDRLRAIGNGQVSRVAAAAFSVLAARADESGGLT